MRQEQLTSKEERKGKLLQYKAVSVRMLGYPDNGRDSLCNFITLNVSNKLVQLRGDCKFEDNLTRKEFQEIVKPVKIDTRKYLEEASDVESDDDEYIDDLENIVDDVESTEWNPPQLESNISDRRITRSSQPQEDTLINHETVADKIDDLNNYWDRAPSQKNDDMSASTPVSGETDAADDISSLD